MDTRDRIAHIAKMHIYHKFMFKCLVTQGNKDAPIMGLTIFFLLLLMTLIYQYSFVLLHDS